MKGTRKQYEQVIQLPNNAIRVATYATDKGITVAYVYKQYIQGKLRIVEFSGYNFVIPN
jgi:hypothetical protein